MFILSEKLYEFLKKVVQIILPAGSSLYIGLAELWGLPAALQVSGTCALLATFLGVCLGISNSTYTKLGRMYDGEMVIEVDEDDSPRPKMVMNEDFDLLEDKPRITLKRVVKRDRPLEAAPPEG